MAFAELWLPIIGAGIYIAWAIGAWYGGDKKLAIWLIFFGVVSLLFLGALQWQHAIISAPEDDLQRREQNELRRANIALKNILGEPIPLPDGRLGGWNFVFNLENIGPTATRTIKMATNACVFDGPITEDFAFEKPPPDLPVQSAETSPIGPHTPMHIKLIRPFSLQLIQDVKAEKKHILLYLRVDYTDIFDGTSPHWLEVCSEVVVTGDPSTGIGNPFSFSFWKRQNSSG